MQILFSILGMALPTLIKLAENVIAPGTKLGDQVIAASTAAGVDPAVPKTLGEAKKKLVMDMCGYFWDNAGSKIFPDIEGIDEKRLFMRIADVMIEELVPQLTK